MVKTNEIMDKKPLHTTKEDIKHLLATAYSLITRTCETNKLSMEHGRKLTEMMETISDIYDEITA